MKRTRRCSERLAASRPVTRNQQPETIMYEVEQGGTLLLAYLDTKNEDDKLLFIQSVYSELAFKGPCSKRIYKAVFTCLEESRSLEMAMASYRILKRDLDSSYGISVLDSLDLASFVEELGDQQQARDLLSLKRFARILTFGHIVDLLQRDFIQIEALSSGSRGGDMQLERSHIYKQLDKGPTKRFKELLSKLLQIIVNQSEGVQNHEYYCSEVLISSVQILISLVLEFDAFPKSGNFQNVMFDGMHKVLDFLHYQQILIQPLVETMSNPALKLRLILKYVSKHGSKSAKRMQEFTDLRMLLQHINDNATSQNLAKSINEGILQFLLAHAFQAFLLVTPREDNDSVSTVCQLLITAFDILFPDSPSRLEPFAKQALAVARLIIS